MAKAYYKYYKKLDECQTLEDFNALLNSLPERDEDGDYQLLMAFITDTLGQHVVAEYHYEMAKKLGFLKDYELQWYEGYGSTLRATHKIAIALGVINKGMKLFPKSKKLKTFLYMVQYEMKKISLLEMVDLIKHNTPDLVDYAIESFGLTFDDLEVEKELEARKKKKKK